MACELVREFWAYLNEAKKGWLAAFALVLVVICVLFLFAVFGSGVIGPFIYEQF